MDKTYLYARPTDVMEIGGVVKKLTFIKEVDVAVLAVQMVGVLDVVLLQGLRGIKNLSRQHQFSSTKKLRLADIPVYA